MNRTLKVEISQQALIHNVNKIRSYAKGKAIIAMIKANAYGCGLSNVWQALEGRVDLFGVASIEEALILRKLGSNTPCLLMQGAIEKEDLQIAANNNFHCMVHNDEQLQWLTELPDLSNKLNIWIKIDTGMHRLGFDYQLLSKVVESLEKIAICEIAGIITHMACADEATNPKNQEQIKRFYTALSKNNKYPISIANSATILNFSDLEENFVRPGIILYGISPLANSTGISLGFLPVMRVKSNIMAVKSYVKGETIGYGATYTCSCDTKVGILPIGYGDGYPRHVAPNTPVFIKGHYAPIIGRVSMDMISIDLTKVPEVSLGDKAELWGLNLPVEVIAKAAGTIPYELICQISTRVPKTII